MRARASILSALAVCGPLACTSHAEPEAVPEAQRDLRARLHALGLDFDDGDRRVSLRELRRFVTVLEALDRCGLVRPYLRRIEVRRGRDDFPYGSRPKALLDQATLRFWTWEGPTAPEAGALFNELDHHVAYLAHELGHLVGLGLSAEDLGTFRTLHQTHPEPEAFVTAYASTSLDEDLAETFAQVVIGPVSWAWRRRLANAFAHHPVLARKLDLMMRHVAAHCGSRLPVWMITHSDHDAGEGPYALRPSFVDGPDPWLIPQGFGGRPSLPLELGCSPAGCWRSERADAEGPALDPSVGPPRPSPGANSRRTRP